MNLPWHVVRKDARRLWLPLVVWACLITSGQAAAWWLQHMPTDDRVQFEWMRWFTKVLFALPVGIGYVLAAGIVMEDPAAGSTAFWKSRPISGARMLRAKILGCLVLLVGAPLLVGLPWWLAGTFGSGDGISALLGAFRWHAVAAGAGLLVATFSATAGQFLAWTVGLQVTAIPVAAALWDKNSQSFGVPMTVFRAAPLGLSVAALLVLAALGAAVLARYQRRPPRAVYSILTVGAVGAGYVLVRVLG